MVTPPPAVIIKADVSADTVSTSKKTAEESLPKTSENQTKAPQGLAVDGSKITKAEVEVHPKPIALKLDSADQQRFKEIFTTLALKGGLAVLSLIPKAGKLKQLKDELEAKNLHPLATLLFFKTEMKETLAQVKLVFTKWKIGACISALGENPWEKLVGDMVSNLQKHSEDIDFKRLLNDFCEKAKLDIEVVTKEYVDEKKWEPFVYYCLELEK